MANYFDKLKWKRRALAALTVTLSASLTLGVMAACTTSDGTTDEDDEEETTSRTDTQLIRNGNFEFYDEMDVEDRKEKTDLINSPDNWTFSSGSPASDTASGIVNADDWQYLSVSGREFTSIDDAVAHWDDDDVTAYDRLKFLSDFEDEIDDLDDSSDAAEFFAEIDYSIDFEDVETLNEIAGGLTLRAPEDQAESGETNVLMIHNQRVDDNGMRGTAQYYTSSTTITLEAGTAAEVSVWVKTSNLYHYYEDNAVQVTRRGGAYIAVENTVGGTTLAEMKIRNINTRGVTENNGWEQFTLYIRANTFATTTFRIKLGLGEGTSDDRYYAVDGYAFFDDLTCKIISDEAYESATQMLTDTVCTLDSRADDKQFDMDDLAGADTFALDLYAGFDALTLADGASAGNSVDVALTKETSGSKDYVSKIGDNRTDGVTPAELQSVAGLYRFGNLAALSQSNRYFQNIYESDFTDGEGNGLFPFADADDQAIVLMSTNGAAYTATVRDNAFTLQPESRMLVSFWVKTSSVRPGKSGAGATLVDGDNRTSIGPFDSTTVDTVDIDDDTKDIYNGWVQCFFFVSNDTDEAKTFYLELTYGPTSVATAAASAYGDGYAVFANFETRSLTQAQLNYASTGTYAQSVTLTGAVDNDSKFADESITSDIEHGLAALAGGFEGVLAGSDAMVEDGVANELPAGLYTGLLNASYAENYRALGAENAWKNKLDAIAGTADTASAWWRNIFGSGERVANQPLVILNTDESAAKPAYGFIARSESIAASAYQRISMRVKLSEGATAYIYLIDTSDVRNGFDNLLVPEIPARTYWYDDDGNIVRSDPSDEAFNDRTDVLFYLEENGLYTKAGDTSGTYYANLGNYEKDEAENLIASDGTIAYYFYNGAYYAYREEVSYENYKYTQVVEDLPDTDDDGNSILRYTAPANPSQYGTAIRVTGDASNAGKWVEVSFYVRTGSEAKDYRLEVWAGSRDGETQIPAGGYVFFDHYTSTDVSDSYDALLSEVVTELKYDSSNLVDPDDASSNLKAALYYTFTFYDSPSYLRYDATEDEEGLGNPYGSYTQSSYSEQIVWLRYDDAEGLQTNAPAHSLFIDYSATDVTVEADDLTDDEETEDTTTPAGSDTNIWLLISSGVLAFALILVIILVAIRRIRDKMRKSASARPLQPVPVRPAAKPKKSAPSEEAPVDEDDPYNE